MNENLKIGADLGQSSLKFTGLAGSLSFASLAALKVGETADMSFLGGKKRKKPVVVEGEFGTLYVGHGAHAYGSPIENLDFERLAGTPEMIGVFYGAMTEYQRQFGRFDRGVDLVVGLPFQMLMGESANVAKFKKQVNAWMAGNHAWLADGERFELTVGSVALAPQALGAPIDYAFDMEGQAVSEERTKALRSECATLSIGSNTVEALVTNRDEDTKRFNGGKAIGVRRLWQRVDPSGLYTFGEFNAMLIGNTLPDEMAVEPHLESWASEISGFLNVLWGDSWRRFHKVFLVGGGSLLLEKHLRAKFNGKTVMLDEPIMAISRGLYKAGISRK
jgi:hypothetical protein